MSEWTCDDAAGCVQLKPHYHCEHPGQPTELVYDDTLCPQDDPDE